MLLIRSGRRITQALCVTYGLTRSFDAFVNLAVVRPLGSRPRTRKLLTKTLGEISERASRVA